MRDNCHFDAEESAMEVLEETATVWTAAQLAERFGPIVLSRISFDPPPGQATEDDVDRWEQRSNRLFELVDGVLVEKAMGSYEALIALDIGRILANHVKPRRLGWVLGADGMLRLWPGRIRIPDACFISKEQTPDGKFPRGERIASLYPDLAVEVLSESNTREEMAEKLRDYFQSGTRLVWYIDPVTQTAEVFTAADQRSEVPRGGRLSGEPVLSGFEIALASLFDVDLMEEGGS
jgi:Uma2 family endonuclease